MQRAYHFVVPPGKQPERIDLFLTHHIENATRSKVQHAIREGHVLVDGKAVKPSHIVSPGESIQVTLSRSAPPDVVAEDIPLVIVFEDDHLLVVNKPAGMVTHPAYANYSGTLVNALMHHAKGSLSALNDPMRPGIVHRLDKDTSGLIVIAKDDVTHAKLAKQFSSRTVDREYWAIVWGTFREGRTGRLTGPSGSVDAALGRSRSDRKKIAVTEGGKPAITDYALLEEFPFCSLLRCKLRTGRTHQIRVHMHHIGHPVLGDATYGGRRITGAGSSRATKDDAEHLLEIMKRQALHAKTIGFVHPATGERVFYDSEVPEDMQRALDFLRRSRPSR